MAGKDGAAPIIIRRSRKRAGKAHGAGMWKIAYADFVTAMMAFFLLMWLLTTSAQADLEASPNISVRPCAWRSRPGAWRAIRSAC